MGNARMLANLKDADLDDGSRGRLEDDFVSRAHDRLIGTDLPLRPVVMTEHVGGDRPHVLSVSNIEDVSRAAQKPFAFCLDFDFEAACRCPRLERGFALAESGHGGQEVDPLLLGKSDSGECDRQDEPVS